jgi:hypoxanthine phosphoribosyltransferase
MMMDYFDSPDRLEERKVLILDELTDTKACDSISCIL